MQRPDPYPPQGGSPPRSNLRSNQMDYLRVKNWDKFQHYKDRNPSWIKLHIALLSSHEWVTAPTDDDRLLMIVLMLIAAQTDNCIPNNPKYIQKVSQIDKIPNLSWILSSGFIEETNSNDKFTSPWPSRHISDKIKNMVFERDNGKCNQCSSINDIEYDHVIPVSKGGESVIDNIQLLCRPCNRKKRVSVASATQDEKQRSLEKRREENREEEREDKKRFFNQKGNGHAKQTSGGEEARRIAEKYLREGMVT